MIVIPIGLVVGLLELYLLSRITTPLVCGENGGKPRIVFFALAKIALFVVALAGTAILAPHYLLHMGLSICGGLVLGAIIQFARKLRKAKNGGDGIAD